MLQRQHQRIEQDFALLLQALPLLSSAILLLLIFVFLFGVAGMQLFQNAAHQVCVNIVDNSYPDPQLTENSDEWGCGHRHCPSNFTCTVCPCKQMMLFCLAVCFQFKAALCMAQSLAANLMIQAHLYHCSLCTDLLARSLTHSLTHSPTHSLTHPLTHPPTHPLTHSPAHPPVHPSCVLTFCSFSYLFVCAFVQAHSATLHKHRAP